MASLALKYRPTDFKDLVGQLQAAQSLKNSIEHNQIGHAYLFYGSRGVGKTSTARILAKALNCQTNGPTIEPCGKCDNCLEISQGKNIDVIEMDAASNRGIEYIRELRENARFSPMKSKFKVYIIDEVHMLTTESFNALLKTLEEPPEQVGFILATTEQHKNPETILSRCQSFVFKKFGLQEIVERLTFILSEESIEYEEEALSLVAKKAEGSMRDSISLLDQILAFSGRSKVNKADVSSVLGFVSLNVIMSFLEALRKKDKKNLITILNCLTNEGYNLRHFLWDFLDFLKVAVLVKEDVLGSDHLNYTNDEIAEISNGVTPWDTAELNLTFDSLFTLYSNWSLFQTSKSSEIQASIEIALIDIIHRLDQPSVSNIMSRIQGLMKSLEGGVSFDDSAAKKSTRSDSANQSMATENTQKPIINEDFDALIQKEFMAKEETSPLPLEENIFE